MLKYKRVSVTGVVSTSVLETMFSGSAQIDRTIKALHFQETTGTLQNDAILEAWVNQEKVLDISIKHFLDNAATPLKNAPCRIPVDIPLTQGDMLSVGITSGTTLSTYDVVAEYEE